MYIFSPVWLRICLFVEWIFNILSYPNSDFQAYVYDIIIYERFIGLNE